MEYAKSLIDKASKVCGGDSALAVNLGIPRQNVYLMRSGKRPISPATAAELADIAGDDAREAAITAVIESAKGTRREGLLKEILGKGLAGGEGAMCHISYETDSLNAIDNIAKSSSKPDSLYIVSIRLLAIVSKAVETSGRFLRSKTACLPRGSSQPHNWAA